MKDVDFVLDQLGCSLAVPNLLFENVMYIFVSLDTSKIRLISVTSTSSKIETCLCIHDDLDALRTWRT